ncbi:MAG TPA: hypothetical protein PKU80_04315 [Candidatus Limiplasma sp.]|nr:hypothetical protein [Candidatus Limiplasma sp.]
MMMLIENQLERTIHAELNMSEWRFRQARQAVELAEGMGSVVWRERFIVEWDIHPLPKLFV